VRAGFRSADVRPPGARMLVARRARTSGLLERGHLVRTGIADVPSARRASCPPLTLFDLLQSPRTPGKMPGGRAGCPRTQCGRDVRAPEGPALYTHVRHLRVCNLLSVGTRLLPRQECRLDGFPRACGRALLVAAQRATHSSPVMLEVKGSREMS